MPSSLAASPVDSTRRFKSPYGVFTSYVADDMSSCNKAEIL